LMDSTSIRTAIIPAKNTSEDTFEVPRDLVPRMNREIQPTRNAQPCHLVGGPQPKPEGLAGNQ
jgi:hypothetical protein